MRPILFVSLTLLSTLVMAATPMTPEKAKMRNLIQDSSNKIIAAPNAADKWKLLNKLKADIKDWRATNDDHLPDDIRIDLSSFVKMYLAVIPERPKDFRSSDCPYYKASLQNQTRADSPEMYDFYAKQAAIIIDALCKQPPK
jgi:hypothetical protein